jgi:hypothetical protein
MRRNLVRVVALVAVCALLGGAFAAGNMTSVRAAGSQDVVYVATGDNFPDALGAGPVAALANGPLLLVTRDAIPGVTLGELNRLQPDTIVIVGGTGVISEAVANALAGLSFSPTVQRLAGADRYATAVEISKSRFPDDLLYVRTVAPGFHFDVGYSDNSIVGHGYAAADPDARIVAFSTLTVEESVAGDGVQCSLSDTEDTIDSDTQQEWLSPGYPAISGNLSLNRVFEKREGEELTIKLVCRHVGLGSPDSRIVNPIVTALTFPP